MKHMRAAATAAAAASVVLLAVGAPASAGQPIIDHWSEHIEHIEQIEHAADNWCPDIPYDVLYVEDAHGTFREVMRRGEVYGASTVWIEGAWINEANGKSLSFVQHGQDKDQKVTTNEDGTRTIEVLLSGPTQYYDTDGNKVFKDVGRNFFTIIVDAEGEFLEFLGGDARGNFGTEGRDFCADLLIYTS